jgi:hypothetical protein
MFQRYFAEAESYASLCALKSIMEGMHTDPRIAFEFLARRYPDQWGRGVGEDARGRPAGESGDSIVLPGVKVDLGAMLERIFRRLVNGKQAGALSLDPMSDGAPRPRDPRPPREATDSHP